MRNTYKLIWSEEALEGLKEIIIYLEQNFSEKDVKKFVKRFDRNLEIIKTTPEVFPLSPKSKSIRRSVLAKLTSVYYQINGETIKLITIIDNRKNLRELE